MADDAMADDATAVPRDARDADDDDLAAFQEALLEGLARGGDPTALKRDLANASALRASYVSRFEPRMVSLGMHLVAKWGRPC